MAEYKHNIGDTLRHDGCSDEYKKLHPFIVVGRKMMSQTINGEDGSYTSTIDCYTDNGVSWFSSQSLSN